MIVKKEINEIKKENSSSQYKDKEFRSMINILDRIKKEKLSSQYKDEEFKNKFDILNEIGKGAFGSVHKAKIKNENSLRAVKIIDTEEIKKQLKIEYIKDDIEEEFKTIYESFINEIECMKICSKNNSNDNSVKYYEYFQTEQNFIIVMELCDTSLQSLLSSRKSGFSSQEIQVIIKQLNNTFKIM